MSMQASPSTEQTQTSSGQPSGSPNAAFSVFRLLRWLAKILRLELVRPGWLAAAAALLFVVFSLLAYLQFSRPYQWHQPYTRFGPQWWLRPAEWNVDAGLPDIKGEINAIALTPDGKRLWIAGDAGLLGYSDDQGVHWTLLKFDLATEEFRVVPTGTTPAAASSLQWPELVSTVHAAGPEDATELEEKPPNKQPQQSSAQQRQVPNQQQQVPNQQQQVPNQQQQVPNQQQQVPSQQQQVPSQQQQSPTQQTGAAARPIDDKNPAKPADVPPPSITWSPETAEFNKVRVGAQVVQTVFITNASTQDVKISLSATRELDWGQFNIAKNQCDGGLLSHNRCTVTVAFAPRSAGDFTAHLRGLVDGKDGLINVTLHGTGVAPPASGAGVQSNAVTAQNSQRAAQTSNTPRAHLSAAPDLISVVATPGLSVIASNGFFFTSKDSGNTWRVSSVMKDPMFSAAVVLPVARFGSTSVVISPRAGNTVPSTGDLNTSRFKLKVLTISDQAGHAFIAGAKGVILRTEDGGNHWLPVTRSAGAGDISGAYERFLPPWYWLALALCGILLTPLLAPPAPEVKAEEFQQLPGGMDFDPAQNKSSPNAPPSPISATSQAPASGIGNQAVSDRPLEPGDPDALGLGSIAAGLSFFLRNDKTRPPLVLGINGRWGSGKSSLMNLLKKELQDSGTQPVWFNAWHHQKEDQLLAALLQAVKTQAVPRLSNKLGWLFRARLAWTRLQKYWFQLAVLAGVLFLMLRVEVFLRDDLKITFGSLLNMLFSNSGEGALKGFLGFLKDNPVITLLTGLTAAGKAISRGLTAFGANPASLLTTISGGSKVKDLDAQTSFRQRFSAEFAEVTQALGSRRMLILIDDLDRCRPEKVRETLEAVNFLVSSGDCFIVLGMARDIVEHCVGLSFARVVDTMGWDAMGLADEEIEQVIEETRRAAEKALALGRAAQGGNDNVPEDLSHGSPGAEASAKRRAFARLYLDKLVQIEVAIPEPTVAQRRLLFQTDQERGRKSREEQRVGKALKISANLARWVTPVVQAALVAMLVVLAGLAMGHYLRPLAVQIVPHASLGAPVPAPSPSSSPAPSPQVQAKAGAADAGAAAPASQPSPTPQPTPAAKAESPAYQPGEATIQPGLAVFWPLYLAAVIGIGAVSNALRQVPPRKVTDTQVFVNALKIWQRLVMTSGARNTPRTARRFQNRVRYLAMRQRALSQGPAQPRLERWLRGIWNAPRTGLAPPVLLPESENMVREIEVTAARLQEFMAQDGSGDAKDWTAQDAAEELKKAASPMPPQYLLSFLRGNIFIPEPTLVALAAVEEYEPAWVRDEESFTGLVFSAKERLKSGAPAADRRDETLLEVVAEHLKTWDGWSNMKHYRRAYLQLGSETHWQGKATENARAAAAGQNP